MQSKNLLTLIASTLALATLAVAEVPICHGCTSPTGCPGYCKDVDGVYVSISVSFTDSTLTRSFGRPMCSGFCGIPGNTPCNACAGQPAFKNCGYSIFDTETVDGCYVINWGRT